MMTSFYEYVFIEFRQLKPVLKFSNAKSTTENENEKHIKIKCYAHTYYDIFLKIFPLLKILMVNKIS